jgi:hypothetical protein
MLLLASTGSFPVRFIGDHGAFAAKLDANRPFWAIGGAMPEYLAPSESIEEVSFRSKSIEVYLTSFPGAGSKRQVLIPCYLGFVLALG